MALWTSEKPVNVDETSTSTNLKFEGKGVKATIYLRSSLMGNIVGRQVWLKEVGTAKYAQYDHAAFASFTVKKKRKGNVWHGTDRVGFCLVVKGWDAPTTLASEWKTSELPNGATLKEARHMGFSKGWVDDFNDFMDPMIEAKEVSVLYDGRGLNPYTGEKRV